MKTTAFCQNKCAENYDVLIIQTVFFLSNTLQKKAAYSLSKSYLRCEVQTDLDVTYALCIFHFAPAYRPTQTRFQQQNLQYM